MARKRLNYAQLFLLQRNFEKIAEIFDHKFDLGLLYPNRRRFHVTEFIGFMGVVGPYFLGIGERDLARNVYQMMKDISPDHPLTEQFGLELNAGALTRWLRRLVGRR